MLKYFPKSIIYRIDKSHIPSYLKYIIILPHTNSNRYRSEYATENVSPPFGSPEARPLLSQRTRHSDRP